MEVKRRGFLGGLIASLFGGGVIAKSATPAFVDAGTVKGTMVGTGAAVQNWLKPGSHMVPISSIRLNPHALRAVDKTCETFKALVESIRANGVVNPLCVNPEVNIIDGAYRYEAAKEAGLTTVPVYVPDISEKLFALNTLSSSSPFYGDMSRWDDDLDDDLEDALDDLADND